MRITNHYGIVNTGDKKIIFELLQKFSTVQNLIHLFIARKVNDQVETKSLI